MPLPETGPLSFSQLKSTYGVTGTSCAFSQLVRGGGFVDNSKNVEVTNAISSIDSYTLNGINQRNTPLALGYSNRYMYGDLTTYSGSIGSGGTWAYGFLYNSRATTSSINNASYINNGIINGANYNMDFLLFHMGTSADINGGGTNIVTEVLTATIGRAGTYYFLSQQSGGGIVTLQIEINTGSGFSTVFGHVGGNTVNISTAQTSPYTFNASVGNQIRVTLYGRGSNISRYYYLSTSSTSPDKTANVLINQNVPSSANNIALSDFYEGE